MEPITLRLPTDLLEELDTESEEAGFSSRSEYIRHLLFNRPDLNQLATTEGSTVTPETERLEELDQTVNELTERIEILTQRVTELEGNCFQRRRLIPLLSLIPCEFNTGESIYRWRTSD
jgi:Arc/MetJ-type ribon-helix-helix transcriptional regulator